jgi:regulator of sigma E protease
MDILIKILQLILSLSILVIVHEFGHFAAAKIFKTRVEKFYLFFNPWFSLFKFNFKGTEYGMGWLPLGGYVKISGMIDESMDKEQLSKPPQPWEFRSKPAWQRLIIMLGGVIMNVVLAIVIYIGLLSYYGEAYLPTSEVNKYGITVDTLAYEMGLRDGDKILSVDEIVIDNFNKIPTQIILEEAKTVQVERNGSIFTVDIPEGFLGKMVKSRNPSLIGSRFPMEIDGFSKNSVAKEAGMEVGDKPILVDGKQIAYFQDFVPVIKESIGKEISIVSLRGSDTVSFLLKVPENGMIGVSVDGSKYFEFKSTDYTFVEAIPTGFRRTWEGIGSYLKQLKLLFSPEIKAYESVGGFITIGSIFPAEWHWESFWRLTAFLSIMLAILNILPIPALDGGHVMFLFYEIIARRKPSDKFLEYAQIVGMVILFSLLILANGNDIIRLFN